MAVSPVVTANALNSGDIVAYEIGEHTITVRQWENTKDKVTEKQEWQPRHALWVWPKHVDDERKAQDQKDRKEDEDGQRQEEDRERTWKGELQKKDSSW